MSSVSASPERAYTESTESLSGRILEALTGVQDATPVADHVDCAVDHKTALAAVRVLGPDVFVPPVLNGTALGPGEAAAVAEVFRVFPAVQADAAADPVAAWRDWATASLLARYGGDDLGAVRPASGCALADPRDWRIWSGWMAQLSPLALPGLDGPVHHAACDNPVALGRGLTRAMLRRDFPTAARLVRWLALVSGLGVVAPVDPATVAAQLRLLGGGGARIALDLAITQRVLDVGHG